MESDRIKVLGKSLKAYTEHTTKLQAENFSGNAIKAFKKYYNAMHIELVEYVKFKKDKALAEKVKDLKLAAEIFKSTNVLIGILASMLVFSGILLIYLYQINVENWLMISVTTIVSISIFILIRKVQTQPRTLVSILKHNGKICEKISTIINKAEQEQLRIS